MTRDAKQAAARAVTAAQPRVRRLLSGGIKAVQSEPPSWPVAAGPKKAAPRKRTGAFYNPPKQGRFARKAEQRLVGLQLDARAKRRREMRATRKNDAAANVGPFYTNRALRRANPKAVAVARANRRDATQRSWLQSLARRRAARTLARKAGDR